jgi:hypothetical protein
MYMNRIVQSAANTQFLIVAQAGIIPTNYDSSTPNVTHMYKPVNASLLVQSTLMFTQLGAMLLDENSGHM